MAGKFQAPSTATALPTDVANFDLNLSAADDTVQKALETLDELVGGGGGVASLAKFGDTPLTGAVTLTGGANVTLTQVGQDISIASSGTGFTGTEGSIPFVGPGLGLIEDNANLFWDDTNNRLGIGTATPVEELDIVGRIKATGGIDSGGTGSFTKRKSIDIGTWDMDIVTTVSVAHGITLLNIRSVLVSLRNDAGTMISFASTSDSGADLNLTADATNIVLDRPPGSPFNNVAYSSVAFTRGWIIIEYI